MFTIRNGDKTVVYHGFDRLKPQQAGPGVNVVLAWLEDSYEVWRVEDKKGLDSLRAYYNECYPGMDVPFTVLTVSGFDV